MASMYNQKFGTQDVHTAYLLNYLINKVIPDAFHQHQKIDIDKNYDLERTFAILYLIYRDHLDNQIILCQDVKNIIRSLNCKDQRDIKPFKPYYDYLRTELKKIYSEAVKP